MIARHTVWNRLDLDVVNQVQIRLVAQTFREKLFTEIFPGRTEVPKTLVFAKNDSHAGDITEILREEFGKGNDFCQKITYRTTGKKPEELLQEFRNDYFPRIAVSVDMIATGTDVKPLECLLFMRNVKSANYFELTKGRGPRVIGADDLKGVTPDADAKTARRMSENGLPAGWVSVRLCTGRDFLGGDAEPTNERPGRLLIRRHRGVGQQQLLKRD